MNQTQRGRGSLPDWHKIQALPLQFLYLPLPFLYLPLPFLYLRLPFLPPALLWLSHQGCSESQWWYLHPVCLVGEVESRVVPWLPVRAAPRFHTDGQRPLVALLPQ